MTLQPIPHLIPYTMRKILFSFSSVQVVTGRNIGNIGICQVSGQFAELEMLGSSEIISCGIGVVGICEAYTAKKENEIFLIYKEFRRDQLQSYI